MPRGREAADEALYRAKLAGRNRVVSRDGWVELDASEDPDVDEGERAAGA